MSQRDQFAMRAMAAIISNEPFLQKISEENENETPSEVARLSYIVADAMLKERERTNKSKAQKELEK